MTDTERIDFLQRMIDKHGWVKLSSHVETVREWERVFPDLKLPMHALPEDLRSGIDKWAATPEDDR